MNFIIILYSLYASNKIDPLFFQKNLEKYKPHAEVITAENVDWKTVQGMQKDILLVNVDSFFDHDLDYFLKASSGKLSQAARYSSELDAIQNVDVYYLPKSFLAEMKNTTIPGILAAAAQKAVKIPTGGLWLSHEMDLKSIQNALSAWEKNKPRVCLFLDRDGIIIKDSGYPHKKEHLIFIPETVELIREAKRHNWLVIGLSNQAGLAKGKFDEKQLEHFTRLLQEHLAAEGASLDALYYCPFHEEGVVAKYKKDSPLRKPKPGMILSAINDFPIQLSKSIMIGDRETDVFENMAITTYLVRGDYAIDASISGVFDGHKSLLSHFQKNIFSSK